MVSWQSPRFPHKPKLLCRRLFEPAKDGGQEPARIQRLALAVLSVGALAPTSLLATGLLKEASSSGPSCFLGQCSFGDRLAEMAAALVAVPLFGPLGAVGSSGWRLPLWTADPATDVIGADSLAFPGTTASLGLCGGIAALAWGVHRSCSSQSHGRPLWQRISDECPPQLAGTPMPLGLPPLLTAVEPSPE